MKDFKHLKNVDMDKLATERAKYLNKQLEKLFDGTNTFFAIYTLKAKKEVKVNGFMHGETQELVDAVLTALLNNDPDVADAIKGCVLYEVVEHLPWWRRLIVRPLLRGARK